MASVLDNVTEIGYFEIVVGGKTVSFTVGEIAEKVGGVCDGDPSTVVTGIAGIRDANPGDITFVSNPRYASAASRTKAAALVVARDWKQPSTAALIRVDYPDKAFVSIVQLFAPPPVQYKAGIHPAAVVAPDAKLGEGISIGPCCVVESGAMIGNRTILGAGCFVGHKVKVGDDCHLYPHVSLREYVQLGNRVIIHDGTVVGSDGFGYTVDQQGVRTKIPQTGIVVVSDDVEIGANTTIDRARFGRTFIGKGVKIDNLVQIAHNVQIGEHAVIVAQVGISGSSMIGNRAILAGQAGIAGHLSVGEGAIVEAQSGVHKDVPAGTVVFGCPALPREKSLRIYAHYQRLPELRDRIVDIERRLNEKSSKE